MDWSPWQPKCACSAGPPGRHLQNLKRGLLLLSFPLMLMPSRYPSSTPLHLLVIPFRPLSITEQNLLHSKSWDWNQGWNLSGFGAEGILTFMESACEQFYFRISESPLQHAFQSLTLDLNILEMSQLRNSKFQWSILISPSILSALSTFISTLWDVIGRFICLKLYPSITKAPFLLIRSWETCSYGFSRARNKTNVQSFHSRCSWVRYNVRLRSISHGLEST